MHDYYLPDKLSYGNIFSSFFFVFHMASWILNTVLEGSNKTTTFDKGFNLNDSCTINKLSKNTQTNTSSSAEKCADRNSSHSEYRHLLYKLSMVKCHQVFCSFKLFSCKFIATNHSFPVFNHYAFRVILLKFHICTRPLRSHTV